MKDVIMALIAGLIVGMLFKFLKLPLPAPPVFSAVVGVFGVYFWWYRFRLDYKVNSTLKFPGGE
ncbi:XapX domain-containing protein [Bacillus sp. SLBN-46]|uniref:DUF1427 family protein n=1 Tax=Bacillus sp. SLBN-46 TaxID=3042283 RepID=UPI00286652AF|nr:XapX domain-containing protein [Bacillus sp. SLBN-46]